MIPNKHHGDKARKYQKRVCDHFTDQRGLEVWRFKRGVTVPLTRHFEYTQQTIVRR